MDFLTETPFRPNAKGIAHDEHPYHQLRIDRGAASRAVEWGEMTAHVSEINEAVDAPEQMLRRDVVFYCELVEQRALRNLPRPHHRQFSHASGELNQHQ